MTKAPFPGESPRADTSGFPAGHSFLFRMALVPPVLAAGLSGLAPTEVLAIAALLTGFSVSLLGVLVCLGLPRLSGYAAYGMVSLGILAACAGYAGLTGIGTADALRGLALVAGAILLGLAAATALTPRRGTPTA